MQRVTVDGMEREMKVKFLRVSLWLGHGLGRAAPLSVTFFDAVLQVQCLHSMPPQLQPPTSRTAAAAGHVRIAHLHCPPGALPRQALSNRIQAKRLCLGQVDRILHARVPILKFRDLSGGCWGQRCGALGAVGGYCVQRWGAAGACRSAFTSCSRLEIPAGQQWRAVVQSSAAAHQPAVQG